MSMTCELQYLHALPSNLGRQNECQPSTTIDNTAQCIARYRCLTAVQDVAAVFWWHIRSFLNFVFQVYGDPLEHPQTESYWGNVNCNGERSCYDEGKRAAECLTFDYKREHNTDVSMHVQKIRRN